MQILIACEESQAVCKAFREKGHRAFSCDLEPCSGGHPEWHIQQDVLPLLDNALDAFRTMDRALHMAPTHWDMVIAFPPCTYMTNASAVRMRVKGKIQKERYDKMLQARDFFMKFYKAPCSKIAIENPVPLKLAELPTYTQIIQPWMWDDPATGQPPLYSKKTCLWIKGLPPLTPKYQIRPAAVVPYINGGCKDAHGNYRRATGGKERDPKSRSKTFLSVAQAMADQWG